MIKAVIFDFDGVLVESFDIKTKAFCRLFESEGPEVVEKVRAYHVANGGISRFEKFRHIYGEILRRELTEDTFDGLCRRFEGLVVEEVVRAPWVKGAFEFLESSAGRYRLFVCSGTPQPEIELIVGRRRIGKYFSSVYGSPAKKADIVKKVLAENGYRPEEVLYVGDAMSDYEAAVSNGVGFIGRLIPGSDIFKGLCDTVGDLAEIDNAIRNVERKRPGAGDGQ